ncbi:hypothetical protein [Brenneria izadpanahii]|nr:hypothetical protein [Brenneria izadpanahii]
MSNDNSNSANQGEPIIRRLATHTIRLSLRHQRPPHRPSNR